MPDGRAPAVALTRDDLAATLAAARRSAFTTEQTTVIDLIAGALNRLPGRPLADDEVIPDTVVEDATHAFVPAPSTPSHCAHPITYRASLAERPHTIPCWASRDAPVHDAVAVCLGRADDAAAAGVIRAAVAWVNHVESSPPGMATVAAWADDYDHAVINAVREYRQTME